VTTPAPTTQATTTTTPFDGYNLVGNGTCRAGKRNSKSLTVLKHLNTNNEAGCAEKCDAEGSGCIGFNFLPNVKTVEDGNWRKENGDPNCRLITQTVTDKITLTAITGSDGRNFMKQKSYSVCHSKIGVDQAETTVTVTTTAEPTTAPSTLQSLLITHTLVGKGSCRTGKKDLVSFDALKLLNVPSADFCASECNAAHYWCIGFTFKPNVGVLDIDPSAGGVYGAWRKFKGGQPNCKLYTHTPGKKGAVLSEITGSSGKPKKVWKADYATCYLKNVVPDQTFATTTSTTTSTSTSTSSTSTTSSTTTTSTDAGYAGYAS